VIDDASTDNSVAMLKKNFPQIVILQNKTNLGYSKSYNLGTKIARGRYLLHLNSDMQISKADFPKALKFLDENPKIGILGCKIVKKNGHLDRPCKRSFPTVQNVFFQTTGLGFLIPNNKLFGNYYLSYLDENKMHEVDCLMGAFMLIRHEVFEKVGFIDERFFMYGEDIDFCLRTKKAGWKITYYPEIVFTHLHGATTSQNKVKSLFLFHHAMYLYYQKHFAPKYSKLYNLVVYLGILLRFLLTLLFSPFI